MPPLVEGAALLSILVLIAVFSTILSGTKGAMNPKLQEWLFQENLDQFFPAITASQLAQAQSNNAVIVDARWERDFDLGHIERAINLPPNSTPEQCLQEMGDMAPDTKIVVYCQSESCSYDTNVAERLYAVGYQNLYIYEAGWVGWSSEARD